MITQRAGFTFVELLLVMLLGLTLLGAAYQTLLRQEQTYAEMGAMTGTREDARTGLELLSAELREVSAVGGDLLMATPDSLRFRALRKFALLCDTDKNNKRLTVAQVGVDPFRAGDSVAVYVDGDSLRAEEDSWQRELVTSVSVSAVCTTVLGLSLPLLLAEGQMVTLTLPGAGLKYDSIHPGAPLRSFEILTYRVGSPNGRPMLLRVRGDTISPLLGPLTGSDGLVLRYFDATGTELTSFPLSQADRESVRRVRVLIRAERPAGSRAGTYQDSLITDVYTRGS